MRLRRLEPALRAALTGPCAVPRGSTLLVAVSGGADSTALLLALRNLAGAFGLSLAAAHLHHGLRGADADDDAAFVRALCERLDVPLTHARWNTALRMRRLGLSGEAGLRTLRRAFLSAAAGRAGASAIATAHTADDRLETMLMRLARGTGLAGLSGMRARRGLWIKPLLEATRADVEADLRRIGQAWREDASNRDARHTRNRMRHGALPAFAAAVAPGADPARTRAALARKASRVAREAADSAESLEWLADDALAAICRIQPGEIALDSQRVGSYPFAARHMVLQRLWSRLDPALPGLTLHHLAAISRLVSDASAGARVALAGGWAATRERQWIRFRRNGPSEIVALGKASNRRFGTDVKSRPPVLADAGGMPRVAGARRAARAGDGSHPEQPSGSRGAP